MSSVTRFIRQIPVSTTYYSAALVANTPATLVFELINDSGNYVGNYPPGYVLPASAALVLAIQQAVMAAGGGAAGLDAFVLRDMGKTIYASYGATNSSQDPRLQPSTANFGYFRQVQLLRPTAIVANNFIGGLGGSNFGVLGGQNIPDNYTDFMTFYIPVSVAGIRGPAVNTGAYAIAGGQM
jgi:hypothetical protein